MCTQITKMSKTRKKEKKKKSEKNKTKKQKRKERSCDTKRRNPIRRQRMKNVRAGLKHMPRTTGLIDAIQQRDSWGFSTSAGLASQHAVMFQSEFRHHGQASFLFLLLPPPLVLVLGLVFLLFLFFFLVLFVCLCLKYSRTYFCV